MRVALSCESASTASAGNHRGSPLILTLCRGLGEAFFGQAIAFYLTLWYLKSELAKRIGLFIRYLSSLVLSELGSSQADLRAQRWFARGSFRVSRPISRGTRPSN